MANPFRLVWALAVALVIAGVGLGQQAGEKKEEKQRGGTIVGTVTEKGIPEKGFGRNRSSATLRD